MRSGKIVLLGNNFAYSFFLELISFITLCICLKHSEEKKNIAKVIFSGQFCAVSLMWLQYHPHTPAVFVHPLRPETTAPYPSKFSMLSRP